VLQEANGPFPYPILFYFVHGTSLDLVVCCRPPLGAARRLQLNFVSIFLLGKFSSSSSLLVPAMSRLVAGTAVSVNAGEVRPWRRHAVSSSSQSRHQASPSSNPSRRFQDLRPSMVDTLLAWKIVNEPSFLESNLQS
jgi:hypothetical protein